MADRFYAAITVPTHLIDEGVEEAMEREHFDESFDDGEGLTQLADAGARYGEFEDLEAYLVGRQIPFDRDSAAYAEYEAEVVFYRPDVQPEPVHVTVTTEGDFFVRADQLKPLLDLAPQHALDGLKALLDERAPAVRPLFSYVPQSQD